MERDESPEAGCLARALMDSTSGSTKKCTSDATQQHPREIASRFHPFHIQRVRRAHSIESTVLYHPGSSLVSDKIKCAKWTKASNL
jgi:hypothetical protein